ncbi:MAG TPA: hypothetical protein VI756_21770 [Blastocatellia bacterium]
MLRRNQQQSSKIGPGTKVPAKVNSIAALPDGRDFVGSFDVSGKRYEFKYTPVKAEVTDKRLVLTGKMTMTDAFGKPHVRDSVRAVLASSQGGLGSPPPVYRSPGENAGAGPRTGNSAATGDNAPPGTDNTGDHAFCGVMYLRLEGLDGPALGVPADFSHTQLNARLFAVDDVARNLHSVYSRLVATLGGIEGEESGQLVQMLNELYREGSVAIALLPDELHLLDLSPPVAAPGR